MSPDCEHCPEHGENTTRINQAEKKVETICKKQGEHNKAINDRVTKGNFRWVVGGVMAGALAFCLAVFGLYDKVDNVGRVLSAEVTSTSKALSDEVEETSRALFERVTETRIDTLNKLADIKIEQHKTTARVEDFGQRVEGLAQGQKILMQQVGSRINGGEPGRR